MFAIFLQSKLQFLEENYRCMNYYEFPHLINHGSEIGKNWLSYFELGLQKQINLWLIIWSWWYKLKSTNRLMLNQTNNSNGATAVQRTVTMIWNKQGEAICESTIWSHSKGHARHPADTNTRLRGKKIKNLTDNDPFFQPSVSLSKKAELLKGSSTDYEWMC